MRKLKLGLLTALLTAGTFLLSSCGQVDESILDQPADFSVQVNIPFPTNTPRPSDQEMPAPVVIDGDGNVTVNDVSLLTTGYTKKETEDSSYRSLALGDTGIAVQTLQQRLKALGYFTNGVSGIFDAETEAAVKRFEQTFGIMRTGIATPTLQVRLFSSSAPIYGSDAYDTAVVSQYTTLQRGSVGSDVYALQYRLRELSYPIDEVTGIFDENTEECVGLFYKSYGLDPQPAAYIAMQKELYSDNARRYTVDGEVQQTVVADNTLKRGNVGTLVMQIQNRLIELRYLDSIASGIFDAETESAVRLFEEACGFDPTGTLSDSLQAILLSEQAPEYGESYETEIVLYDPLYEGSEGEAVLALQNRLIQLGYAAGAGNGVYGAETAAAIRMFQRYNDLEQTGRADSEVQAALYSPLAISYQDVLSGITSRSTPEPMNTPAPPPQNALIGEMLTLNSTGDAVIRLQNRLHSLGYDLEVSGVYDQDTVRAVRILQSAIGVSQTGEASAQLQLYINSNASPAAGYVIYNAPQHYSALQYGDSGEAVTALQQRLWQLGYLLTSDVQDSIGVYHEATFQAVTSAQLAMGYTQTDGVAGAEFQCFLFSVYGENIKR